MAITVQTTATTLVSTAGTTHAINMPASVAVGDLLVVFVSFDGAYLQELHSVTSGTNWRCHGVAHSSFAVTGAVYWKIAEGSDGLTFTTTANTTSSAVAYRISGATGISGHYSTGSSTNSNPPLYDSGLVARNALYIASRHSDSNVIASAAPSGYSSLIQIQAANTSGTSTDTAYKASTLSREDPNVFTSATEQWVCWTIAVWEDVEVITVTEGGGTFASGSPGTVAWSNPSNASALDGTAAIATVNGNLSQTLKITNFGFSIPTGAVIDGIQAVVYKNMETGGGAGYVSDENIQLVKGGTASGTSYAGTEQYSGEWQKSTTTFFPSYYGRGSDLWGLQLFPSDINDSTFGIVVQCEEEDGDSREARVDYVSLSVTYLNVCELKFNYRATSNYVTDGRNEIYVLGETSSQTRGGITFQWNTCADCTRDRSTSVGSKFAGVNRRPNDGTQNTFTVTLPQTGTWKVGPALGDATNSASATYAYFYDNTTLIGSVTTTASPTTADYYLDSAGNTIIRADWEEDQTPITHDFASTTFKMTIGSSTNTSGETRVAHLQLQFVPSSNVELEFVTAEIEIEALPLDAEEVSPLDIEFSVATMVLDEVEPLAELGLLPSTITTESPNLNTYIRAILTLKDINDGSTMEVAVVNRELLPEFENHFPLLQSANGIGLAMGQFLPESSRATLIIDNRPNTLGSQRRFADLLERKTIIEQKVEIAVAQIALGREDITESNFVDVWRAKVTNVVIRPNDVRISISRSELPIRTITKLITRDNFPDAPESSLGKALPIVFSENDSYVEVEPIRITDQFDLSSLTRVDYAYATTFADQHVVSSVVTAPHRCFLPDAEGRDTEAVFVDPGSPIAECDFGPTTDWFSDPWLALKEGGFLLLPGQNITEGNVLVGVDFYFKSLENATFTEQEGQGFTVRVYSRGLNGWPENILASSFNELLTDNANIVYEGLIPDFDSVSRHRFRFKFAFNRYVVVPEEGVFVTIARDTEEDTQWELVKDGTSVASFPNFQTFQKLDPGSTDYDATGSSPDWYFAISDQGRICMEVYGLGQNDDPDGGDTDAYENGLGHARWGTRMRIQEAPDLTRINWSLRVKGLRDDSSGSITGTPSQRITQVKHATRLLLREWNGSAWVDSIFNSTKFSETHNTSVIVQGATRGRLTVTAVLEQLMRNSGSKIVPYYSGSTASVALWSWGVKQNVALIVDDENAELVSAEIKGVETIINHFQGAYDRRLVRRVESLAADGTLSDYYGFFDSENSIIVPSGLINLSQSIFGIRPMSNINFDWVADSDSIEYLAKFFLLNYNEPQKTVILRVPYYNYQNIEVTNVVALKMVSLPAYFGTTHDARYPFAGSEENDVDLVAGHYWKRSQTYRAQILANELVFARNQPLQRQLTLRILTPEAIT